MSKLIRCSIETHNQISAILVCRTAFIFAYVLALLGTLLEFALGVALVCVALAPLVGLPGTDAVDETRTITITFWTALTFAFGIPLSSSRGGRMKGRCCLISAGV